MIDAPSGARAQLISEYLALRNQLRLNQRLELVKVCKHCVHTTFDHLTVGPRGTRCNADVPCLKCEGSGKLDWESHQLRQTCPACAGLGGTVCNCSTPEFVTQGRYTVPLTDEEHQAIVTRLQDLQHRLRL